MSLKERFRAHKTRIEEENKERKSEAQRAALEEAVQREKIKKITDKREKPLLDFASKELAPLLKEVNNEYFGGNKSRNRITVCVGNTDWFSSGQRPFVEAVLTDYVFNERRWCEQRFWSLTLRVFEDGDVKIIGAGYNEFACVNLNNTDARQKIEDTIFDAVINRDGECSWTEPRREHEDHNPWSR